MKKIELKLTTEKLSILVDQLKIDKPFATASKEDRVLLNISRNIHTRLSKKVIDKQYDLKPFKLFFEYFEAYFIWKVLNSSVYLIADAWHNRVITDVIIDIDKQIV